MRPFQHKRTAVSIVRTDTCHDFARFIEIATGSVFEVVSQATISKRQGFLTQDVYAQVYAAAEKQSRMLSGLRRSLDLT